MSIDKRIDKLAREAKASIVYETHSFNINIETREIFVHGYFGDFEETGDPGTDWRMAATFLKNIRMLEGLSKDKIIFVHQYNSGGSWDAGIMIYDAIKACSAPVIFVMWGCACSMGSIIPQAADKRIITQSCTFMVHDGTTEINPGMTTKQSRSWHDWEKTLSEKMLDIYVESCQNGEFFYEGEYSEEDIKDFIRQKMDKKEDWWLNSHDAVKYGFADGVLGDEGFETLLDIKNNWITEEDEE